MKKKVLYEKPSIVAFGSVYGLTRGHFKVFGPGDGIILVDSNGDAIGPVDDAPSNFH